MKKYVNWQDVIGEKDIAEWFIELGKLDEIDAAIIRGRRDKRFQFEVASDVNVSIDTVKNRTAKLIKTYKKLSKKYPDIFKTNKEYQNVTAAVSLITSKHDIYSVYVDMENFDSFDDIRTYVIKEIERRYKIKVDDLKEYKTVIGGTYYRNTIIGN